MIRKSTTAFPVLVVCAMVTNGLAEDQKRQLLCEGVKIEPAAVSHSPIKLGLNLGTRRGVSIDLGSGSVNARIISDNQIQLKSEPRNWSASFFHYTNDLFLIYPSGHLARLTCEPRG